MDNELYLNSMLGLCFVIGLIFICAYIARKYGLNAEIKGPGNRVKILSSKSLDVKAKLVLIQKDDMEYLVLISPSAAQENEKKPVKQAVKPKPSKPTSSSPKGGMHKFYNNYKRRDE